MCRSFPFCVLVQVRDSWFYMFFSAFQCLKLYHLGGIDFLIKYTVPIISVIKAHCKVTKFRKKLYLPENV